MEPGCIGKSNTNNLPAPTDLTENSPGEKKPRSGQLYSLTSENLTQIKRYTAQILSYEIFSFCEQTLKIGANDASGQRLQYAL
jgi:hypothetical protein